MYKIIFRAKLNFIEIIQAYQLARYFSDFHFQITSFFISNRTKKKQWSLSEEWIFGNVSILVFDCKQSDLVNEFWGLPSPTSDTQSLEMVSLFFSVAILFGKQALFITFVRSCWSLIYVIVAWQEKLCFFGQTKNRFG